MDLNYEEVVETVFKYTDRDERGLLLDRKYLMMSIDGSPFVSVDMIIEKAKEIEKRENS